jgi:hypothetical protein
MLASSDEVLVTRSSVLERAVHGAHHARRDGLTETEGIAESR